MECYAVRWLGSRLCVCTVQACGLPAAHDCLPLMTEDLPFQWKKFGMEGVALLGGEVDCRWVSWRPPRYCVCEPQPHGVGVILELREHSSVRFTDTHEPIKHTSFAHRHGRVRFVLIARVLGVWVICVAMAVLGRLRGVRIDRVILRLSIAPRAQYSALLRTARSPCPFGPRRRRIPSAQARRECFLLRDPPSPGPRPRGAALVFSGVVRGA